MLEPILHLLNDRRVILASSSPRRQEILKNAGLKFTVMPSDYDEGLNPSDFNRPEDYVIANAMHKVADIRERLESEGEDYDLIIGADTIAYKDSKVYGKPKNEEEAFKMLQSLSGESHTIYSGVCLKNKEKSITFSESTEVYFGKLPDEVLKAYSQSGDPLDKAGGYGIQVKGGTFVERIEGDYYNVVGLPLYRLCKHLYELYMPKF